MTDLQKADLVLTNATVWTVDPSRPLAQAVAIKAGRILAVGAKQEMDPLIGAGTEIHDLGGRLLLPGFNDCHTHMLFWITRSAGAFNLYGADRLEEIQSRLQRHAQENPDVAWLFGMRWQPGIVGGELPTAADLDVIVKDRPVAILDIDCHTAWVNNKGLVKLGFDESTPDPLGGTIVRDGSGHPTGILLETAHYGVPWPIHSSYEEFKKLLIEQVASLNRLGITSLSDNYIPLETVELAARVAEEGALNLRMNYWPLLMDGLDTARSIRKQFKANPQIQVVGLKSIIDGVLSTRTAWMLEPYPNFPEESGYPLFDVEELTEQVVQADKDGFQVVIHAIGNRGVREVLNMYEHAARENGARDSRHRIEHVEVAHPDDQKRFVDLGVIASMTPVHYCEPITYQEGNTVREDHYPNSMSVWRTYVDSGVHLCFGTDWPAVDLAQPDPLKQIFAAVSRVPPQMPEAKPKNPEQALTVEQAIRSYTLESAYAEFTDDVKGSIAAGKVADLCVLSNNILEIDPQDILDTKVVMTVFDGHVVFSEI